MNARQGHAAEAGVRGDTTTDILWQAADKPQMKGSISGQCRVCGNPGRGIPFDQWVRKTFTNWDLLVPGNILCHACQFAFEEHSKTLAHRLCKDDSQYVRMRNYSHFVVEGEWLPLSKSDKEIMTEILLRRLWSVAIIAQSGQKHLIFRGLPNVVQFEEKRIRSLDDLEVLLATIEMLYTKFSKTEIRDGDYSQYRILDFGLDCWQGLEAILSTHRGAKQFALGLFLAQKKEWEVLDEQYGGIAKSYGGALMAALERHTRGLQEQVPSEHLGSVRGEYSGGSVHEQSIEVSQLDLL